MTEDNQQDRRVSERWRACCELVWRRGVLRHAVAVQTFIALLLFGLIYRVRLCGALYASQGNVLGFSPAAHPRGQLLGYVSSDLFLALAVAALVWLAGTAGERLPVGRFKRAMHWLGLLLLNVVLATIAIIYQSHYALLFSMNTGLVLDVIVETLSADSFGQSFGMLQTADWLFLAAPIALFWILPPLLFWCKRPWRDRAAFTLALAPVLLALLPLGLSSPRLSAEIRLSPVWFTLADVLRSRSTESPFDIVGPRSASAGIASRLGGNVRVNGTASVTFDAQRRSVELIHPMFVDPVPVDKQLPPIELRRRAWNLLFVVMESTGMRYVFESPVPGKVPMPFLKSIGQRGWLLKHHVSPSNSSARSLFAIFSGLYPMPEVRMFSTRKKLQVPSLFALLPATYDRFLVTPSPLSWFFPRHYFISTGLSELHGYTALRKVQRKDTGIGMSRDEPGTVDFFIRRVEQAREPFAAVYISFVAHWPYPDYGPEYRLLRPVRQLHKYTNNLVLLDRQIERIFDHLTRSGQLARTIVIIVGDHGEAFGQHKGNWTHSRWSYNENFETPAIIYQPALFKPRVIPERTAHIDLLPTLLDAMALRYNPRLMQGESLFQTRLRRKYVFLFGNEHTLSSISRDNIKLQLSFKRGRCWVFDLGQDPDEQRQLSCDKFAAQREATLRYYEYQRQLLRTYNHTWGLTRRFFGQTHRRGPKL